MYEPVLVKIQLYMAINLRREAEAAAGPRTACTGTSGCSRRWRPGDPQTVLTALANHGARSYLD